MIDLDQSGATYPLHAGLASAPGQSAYNASTQILNIIKLFIRPETKGAVLQIRTYGEPILSDSFDKTSLYVAAGYCTSSIWRPFSPACPGVASVLIPERGSLPFLSGSFDYIVLSSNSFGTPSGQDIDYSQKLRLEFRELHRLLKPTGYLLGCFQNRWSHISFLDGIRNRAGLFTYLQVQKELNKAGFPNTDFFSLGRDNHTLMHFVSKLKQNHLLGSETRSSLKSKLKNGLLAHHFIFSASAKPSTKPYPFHETQNAVKQALNKHFGPGSLQVQSHTVSRKDKIIYTAHWGEKNIIIKTPFSQTANASEENNFRCLEHLSKLTGLHTKTPCPITSNIRLSGTYFIESALSGLPLAHFINNHERIDPFSTGFNILEELFLQSSKDQQSAPPLPTVYNRLIQARIDRLYQYTSDAELKARLQNYFFRALNWDELPTGICHGDFSVSNILIDPKGNAGLIDWETADTNGLPILDAINFLDSYFRLINKGCRVNQSIPAIASSLFPDQKTKQFMADAYRLYSIDPAHHQALVYLRWLHHASYLIQFWLRFDKKAQDTYIYDIAKTLPSA